MLCEGDKELLSVFFCTGHCGNTLETLNQFCMYLCMIILSNYALGQNSPQVEACCWLALGDWHTYSLSRTADFTCSECQTSHISLVTTFHLDQHIWLRQNLRPWLQLLPILHWWFFDPTTACLWHYSPTRWQLHGIIPAKSHTLHFHTPYMEYSLSPSQDRWQLANVHVAKHHILLTGTSPISPHYSVSQQRTPSTLGHVMHSTMAAPTPYCPTSFGTGTSNLQE